MARRYALKGRYVPSEFTEQSTVVSWAEYCGRYNPDLRLLYAVPNGARTSMTQAKKLKAEGMKAGVPDLFLPVPRHPWHGLYIEMKRIGGRVSTAQKWWIEELGKQGYFVAVCQGSDEAIELIKNYLRNGGK